MKRKALLRSESFMQVLRILLVAIVFFSTQFQLPINLMGRTIYLYYVEPLLAVLFVGVAVRMLIKKKKPCVKPSFSILFGCFLLWFVLLTAYRFLKFRDITGGFIIFRVLTFPVIFVLLLRHLKLTRQELMGGLFLFATALNLYQVYSAITVQSFRTLKALANINIYLCFMLTLLPLLMRMLKQVNCPDKAGRIAIKVFLVFDIVAILVFSFFSGSRLAAVMLLISFIVGGFFALGFQKQSLLRIGALFLAFAVSASLILSLDIFDSRYNVSRTYAGVFASFGGSGWDTVPEPDATEIADITEPGTTDSVSPTESNAAQPENPDDATILEAQENLTDSNTMRSLLWKNSIREIRKSPFWGRTSVDVEIEMTFVGLDAPVTIVQSPHNFILEGWMALGLPGLLLYAALIVYTLICVLRKKIPIYSKLTLLTMLAILFGFSFFQPLVTCYFAISLMLWSAFYAFLQEDASSQCDR